MSKCRICGAEFEACLTTFDSVLGNWKQFCCCINPCAQTYYEKIMESRNPKKTANKLQNFNEPILNDIENDNIFDIKNSQSLEYKNTAEDNIKVIEEIVEPIKVPIHTRRRKPLDKIE